MVGAVLVAGDDDAGDLAEGDRAARVVGLAEPGVHAFKGAQGDAGHLAEPGRGGEDHDVGGLQLLVDGGPFVAVALVAGDARLDVQIDQPDQFDLGAALLQLGDDHLGQGLGRGRLRAKA